jgi:hypothetical protein
MPKNTAGLKRGGPGRKPGVPNKVTREVRDLAEALISNDAYLATLRRKLLAGKCNPQIEAMLWHYRYGKPKDTVEITGENGGPISVIRRVIVDPDESE